MERFSKHDDIEAVLQKAGKDISMVEQRYNDLLKKQTIPDDLLVDVKDCIANIRTALDYAWCKIPGVAKTAHFPIGNSVADFQNKVQGIDAKYVETVEKLQTYGGDTWLEHFSFIRNKNEHLTLIPQVRKETREFSVKKGGSGVTMRGCTFGGNGTISISVGGVLVPIDKETQFPAQVEGVNIERRIWVDFLFDCSSISPDFPEDISVLSFLKKSFSNAVDTIQKLEK